MYKKRIKKKKEIRERERIIFLPSPFFFLYFSSFLRSKLGIIVKSPALTNKQALNCRSHF
jgi:hypothetical protein